MKIYVAGSSDELDRAVRWMDKLRGAGIAVVSTWPDVIKRVGSANPIGVVSQLRKTWAYDDLIQVQDADWFWMLAPEQSPGRGAYVELGVAWAERKHIIVSGHTEQSIFNALGLEYRTDEEAFAKLVEYRKEHGG